MGSNDDDSGNRERDHYTPFRGVPVLDAEMQSLERRVSNHERRLREIEHYQAALTGVANTPGVIGQQAKELSAMRADFTTHTANVASAFDEHDKRITGVEHITFKIVAAASIASLIGGVLTTIIMKLVLH